MKNENWAEERANGKVIVPEGYEDMPQEWLESFGYIRKEDVKITDYDEELEQYLSTLIDVPFQDLKPYLADNINKIFINGNEFKAVFEEAKKNYAQALNENNKLVRLFSASFARLKWPDSYAAKLKIVFEAIRNEEATYKSRGYADEMWDAAANNGRYKDEDEAAKWLKEYDKFDMEYIEAGKHHTKLKKEMAKMSCPELFAKKLVAKKDDGAASLQ